MGVPASILANAGISIDTVLQREADEVSSESATQTELIILTHDCVEATMNKALAQMQALKPCSRGECRFAMKSWPDWLGCSTISITNV